MSTFTLFFILLVLVLAYAVIGRKRPKDMVPHAVIAVIILFLYDGVVRDELLAVREQPPKRIERLKSGEELCTTRDCLEELLNACNSDDIDRLAPRYRRVNGNLLAQSKTLLDSIRVFLITDEMAQVVKVASATLAGNMTNEERKDFLFYLSFAYARLDQHDSALVILDRVSSICPDCFVSVCARAGSSLLAQGKTANAEEMFRIVLKADPEHSAALHSLGCLLVTTGRPEEGVAYLKKALTINPESRETAGVLVVALDQIGRDAEAAEVARKALSEEPGSANLLGLYGGALVRMRKYEEALEPLKQALDRDSLNGIALSHIGKANFYLEQYDQAVIAFKKLRSMDSTDADICYVLGRCYEAMNCDLDALLEYERSYKLYREPDVLARLAQTNLRLNRFDASLAAFNEWISQSPHDLYARVGRGSCLAIVGRFAQAIDDFAVADSLSPNNVMVLAGLAECYNRLDKRDQALEISMRAVEIDSTDYGALFGLYNSLSALGRFHEACDVARKISANMRDDSFYMFDFAISCGADQHREEMLDYLEQALRLDSTLIAEALRMKPFEPYYTDPQFRKIVKLD